MATGNDQIDDFVKKMKQVSGVVAEGVSEKYQEHGGSEIAGNLWSKTLEVTNSIIKGVSDGASADVDKKNEIAEKAQTKVAQLAVRRPNKSIYSFAFVAGVATACGVGRYLVNQEVALRILLRAMSKDWTEDVGDGLVGPVGHMYRPFFAEVDRHLQSATTPRGQTHSQRARNWWMAGAQVTASPTATKQMYHGMMAACHTLSFIVRFRYHLAHGRPTSLGEPLSDSKPQVDAVEKFAFDIALFVKKAIKGKLGEKDVVENSPLSEPKTRSGEAVPEIGTLAVGGSCVLALWHWVQFAQCYAQRGGALYVPIRKQVVDPLTRFLRAKCSAKVLNALNTLNVNLETLALVGESVASVAGGLQLLIPCSTRYVAATAALRAATFGKLIATTHRLFDDTEHTLHCYGSLERQMIFVASTGLALTAVMTPRVCDYSGVWRTFSVISRGVGISAFFHGRSVFGQPHAVRNTTTTTGSTQHTTTTVCDTFTVTVCSYAVCFIINLVGAHHLKSQIAGLSMLGGLLYNINRVVQRDQPTASAAAARQPPSVSTATAEATTSDSAPQSPREDPPSYQTATKSPSNRTAAAADVEEVEEEEDVVSVKAPAALPSSSDSDTSNDSFEHIQHDDAEGATEVPLDKSD